MHTGRVSCRTVLVVAFVGLAVLAAPIAASATPGGSHRTAVQHGKGAFVEAPSSYAFADDFDPECPGLSISGHFEQSGVTSTKAAKGTGGQAFYFKDSYRFAETWTDNTTGKVIFTVDGRYVFEEVSARFIPNDQVPPELVPPGGLVGPVYLFNSTERGQDTFRDGSGKVLYATAGTITFEALFDTLGDFAPGGVGLGGRIVSVTGPHPLLDVDYCDVARDLIAPT